MEKNMAAPEYINKFYVSVVSQDFLSFKQPLWINQELSMCTSLCTSNYELEQVMTTLTGFNASPVEYPQFTVG